MPMQTVTKPIMLDETGQAIVAALSGLTDAVKPDAINIPYDNSDSGLISETVQEAIDENTDSISELNSSMDSFNTINPLIITTGEFTANTVRTFTLNESYNNYLMLMIVFLQYNNVYDTIIVPVSYFKHTGTGTRLLLYIGGISTVVEVYQTSSTTIAVKTNKDLINIYHVQLNGVHKIV